MFYLPLGNKELIGFVACSSFHILQLLSSVGCINNNCFVVLNKIESNI